MRSHMHLFNHLWSKNRGRAIGWREDVALRNTAYTHLCKCHCACEMMIFCGSGVVTGERQRQKDASHLFYLKIFYAGNKDSWSWALDKGI
ncbi:hypothetical protein AAHA92_28525 [Salvia divinorum]|uniref:Uncharacterized protein n=1 Tax=Salvia divinorum TaxID=28513 RepID=A0ABD1FYI4_SALDI